MGNGPRADAFAIDMRFVPLPLNEREERRRQLRTLLLRGALRAVQQQAAGQLQSVGVSLVTCIEK